MTPRIAPVTDPDPELQELLGKTLLREGRPLNIFTTLAHHPRLLKRFNSFGGLLLGRGLLDARLRELAILRTGWRTRSPYEFAQHIVIGREAGVTDDEIERVTDDALSSWPAREAAVLRCVDELCAGDDVGDPTWTELAGLFGEPELVELLVLVGFYRMVAGFLNACRVPLDEGLDIPAVFAPPGRP